MKLLATSIPDVVILKPKIFKDERGNFYESYNRRIFQKLTGFSVQFVQDNCSRSKKNVLRGLHYQIQQPQGKLISVTEGEVFDVVVDIRKSSATFGQWLGTFLSAQTRAQLWVPPGFAHGFLVITEVAEVWYKVTEYWAPQYERCLLWNDPVLEIKWPTSDHPVVSKKDSAGTLLANAELFD